MKISLINSKSDNAPLTRGLDWSGLVALLSTSRRLGVGLPEFKALSRAAWGDVKNGPAWIPGEFSSGRKDDGLLRVEALVFDFDDLQARDEPRLWESFAARRYVAHTSASHSPGRPKWRVVLQLERPIEGPELKTRWKERWTAAARHFGLTGRLAPDKVACNPARIYYLPAHLSDVEPALRVHNGEPFALHALPRMEPYRPPPAPALAMKWWSEDFVRQARNFLRKMGPAVEGAAGDGKTYRVACVLIRDFALPESTALELFREWNATCSPPWPEDGLVAKLRHALKYGTSPMGLRRDACHHGGVDKAAVDALLKFVGSKA